MPPNEPRALTKKRKLEEDEECIELSSESEPEDADADLEDNKEDEEEEESEIYTCERIVEMKCKYREQM